MNLSLSTVLLAAFVFLTSLNFVTFGDSYSVAGPLVSWFIVGIVGLVYVALVVLAALGVYDGRLNRPAQQ